MFPASRSVAAERAARRRDGVVTADLSFFAAVIPATILVGLSKGGFAGLSILAQPLLAMALSPVKAAAILLPVLIVQDVVSLWVYWGRWDRRHLSATLPAAIVGIVIGTLFAARVPDAAMALAIGLISVVEALRRLLSPAIRPLSGRWARLAGPVWGGLAGMTSMIANAGGPPFQIYLLRQRLGRDAFVATGVAFFAAVNWIKLPFFLALGQVNADNLATSATLVPVAVAATWVGVLLVRRVPVERFYRIIYGLLLLVGCKLVFSALAGPWT